MLSSSGGRGVNQVMRSRRQMQGAFHVCQRAILALHTTCTHAIWAGCLRTLDAAMARLLTAWKGKRSMLGSWAILHSSWATMEAAKKARIWRTTSADNRGVSARVSRTTVAQDYILGRFLGDASLREDLSALGRPMDTVGNAHGAASRVHWLTCEGDLQTTRIDAFSGMHPRNRDSRGDT